MITNEQIKLINKEAGKSLSAKLRKRQEEKEIQLRLAQIEAEDEALIVCFESDEVEVLLDKVEHTEKPQAKEAGRITKALPNNRVKVTINDFARFIERGCSFKSSVLTSTTKDSFVSSNIVALDVDNKESYTTIDEFIKLTGEAQLKPFMLYETFSSTEQHQRFRVLYRFDRVITDPDEIDKLYNYVWALFPTVDLDYSVDYSKILYGGKKVVFHNKSVNEVPDLSNVSIIKKKTVKAAPKQKEVKSEKHITPEEVKNNIAKLSALHKNKVINAQWINENIKLTDILEVEEGQRFRCILPSHEDEHPSSRVITDKENPKEQVYICTCESSGSRVISLYAKLFGISNKIAYNQIVSLLGASKTGEYQRKARESIQDLIDNLDYLIDERIMKYLKNSNQVDIYLLLLRIASDKIVKPLTDNEDDIAFFASGSYIKERMELEALSGSSKVRQKLSDLCRIGLIRCIPFNELSESAKKATKANAPKLNGKTTGSIVNHYCILDLTPERIDFIINNLEEAKRLAYRKRGANAQRQINTYGKEYIRENVHVQGYNKKSDKLVIKAVKDLMNSGAKFFSESDINKQIRKKNHKITKKEAELKILDFMPQLIQELDLERIRVNKKTRKQYDISRKDYASNSIVYIAPENTEILDFVNL